MKVLGIIPSRYASTRFPGKPLIDLGGKYMIQRVWEQANKAYTFTKVIVATDHSGIYDAVKAFGGEVIMTEDRHSNGTERCFEAYQQLGEEYDYIVNIQGDEPFIDPKQIDTLGKVLDGEVELATLVKKVQDQEVLFNPNVMKVVFNKDRDALYFSRQCIPHIRGKDPDSWLIHHTYYKHIGIYAYRADILSEIVKIPLSLLEKAESLEQLRWLENGYKIKVAETDIETFGIDTPEDMDKAIDHLSETKH
ncbi:MAG: 3-deoxy-manno-octulosonate cytidylyltransferase [Cyclobacteriaceae bacterium]